MRWLPLAGTLALLASAGPALAEPSVIEAEIVETLPDAEGDLLAMQRERFRRMTVPVTIMGQGPFRFMIDTGAQATVLSHELAEQLQLHDRSTATLVGMASRREVETTPVQDFTLGSRVLSIRRAPIVSGSHIGGADGILGLDTLQDQRVLLDFANDQILVADASQLGGNRGYDIVVRARRELGQLIIARASLDGVRVSVVVDTGAQGTVANQALFDRMRRMREIGVVDMTDINGVGLSGTTWVARALELGRAELTNFPVTLAHSPTFEALGLEDRPTLILGMNELRLFERVAIDFGSRRVLFDVPDNGRRVSPGSSYRYQR